MTIEQMEELRYIVDLIDCERDLMSENECLLNMDEHKCIVAYGEINSEMTPRGGGTEGF